MSSREISISLFLFALVLLPFVIGYLLGSIPFGLILTKLAGQGDIRKIGSGNIGATNVLRTGKKWLAALTVLLDGGKGALAVLVTGSLIPWLLPRMGWELFTLPEFALAISVAGLAAVLGHMFPVWLRFKGGKSVATALGVFTVLCWPAAIACMATWLLVAVLFRFSSLAALVAMALAPLYAYLWAYEVFVILFAVVSAIVIAKHHGNIRRLIKGEEPRIGKSG